MPWDGPVSMEWPDNRALLLVHGIGDAGPGYYDEIIATLKHVPGVDWDRYAIYPYLYDFLNDWFAEKIQLADRVDNLRKMLGLEIGDGEFGQAIAESVGDIIGPVLSLAVRSATRAAYLAQLKQMVLDGMSPGRPAMALRMSIVCHSLGCFHTYEALHAAVREPGLRPATDGVVFANVVFMASPVQLIRTVAGRLGPLVPDANDLATLAGDGLTQPSEMAGGKNVFSVENWISVTGDLDPVGGHFLRQRQDWAYMDVPGQRSCIAEQDLGIEVSKESLAEVIKTALAGDALPAGARDPHSWVGYVESNSELLRGGFA